MKTLGCVVVAAILVVSSGCNLPTHTAREFDQAGMRALRAGDYIGARAMFSAALESGPERPDTLYYLGECYRRLAVEKAKQDQVPAALRNADLALLYYTQAIDAHPAHGPAIRAKSDALEMKGDYEKSLEMAEWAGKQLANTTRRGARWYLDWARRLEARGDFDVAKLRYEQAMALEPESATARAAIGGFFKRLGDRDRAVLAYREAYRLEPHERGVAAALRELGAYPAEAVTVSAPEDGDSRP